MPSLEIVIESGTAFRCGIESWLQSSEEKREWQHLVTHVVQYAFTSKSATLITISPMQWSIGYSLPGPRRLSASQTEYLVNKIESCSDEVLADIAESEEFQRGLLWFLALDVGNEKQLLSAINQINITSTNPPAPSYELLLLLDDGRKIHWLNPSRDVYALKGELRHIAQTFRWPVKNSEAVDRS